MNTTTLERLRSHYSTIEPQAVATLVLGLLVIGLSAAVVLIIYLPVR